MSNEMMDKDQWVSLFRDIGLDEDTMLQWHRLFESRHPQAHQSFLEWLQVPEEDIQRIRAL